MELFLLYLVLQLDTISKASVLLLILCFAIGGGAYVHLGGIHSDDARVIPMKILKVCAVVSGMSLTAITLLPSTKSATILAGAYALKEVSKTDSAQRLAGRSVKLIEDWLESLEPAKKEKK